MENLVNLGIDNEIINTLIESYGFEPVDSLNANYENTRKIMNLVNAYGIVDVDLYLLHHFEIFTFKYEDIKKALDKTNSEKLIKDVINDDDCLAEYIINNI